MVAVDGDDSETATLAEPGPEPEPEREDAGSAEEVRSGMRAKAFNLLESMPIQITSLLMTLFALFMFDINAALLPPSADFTIQFVMTIAFVFFVSELIVTAISSKRFYADLFFWLDVIATLSIIPDVPWLMDGVMIMLGQEPSDGPGEVVRAGGRVARVGARAARMVRVMRLLRLLRIFKLLRFLKKGEVATATKTEDLDAQHALKNVVPSTLASDISATISRRVVLILLFVLIAANIFASVTIDAAPDLGILMLKDTANTAAMDTTAKNLLLLAKPNLIYLAKDKQPIYTSVGSASAVAKDRVEEDLRATELKIFRFESPDTTAVDVELWLDESENVRSEAAGTLMLLISLVVILLSSNYIMSNDSMKIVGEPLERVARAQQATQAIMSAFKKITREGIDFDEVSRVMVATGHRVLDAEVVNVFLLDNVAGELWATHTADDPTPYTDDLRVARGVGLVGKVCATNETANVNFASPAEVPDDLSLKGSLIREESDFEPRNVLAVAILKGDTCVGVLQVINKIEDTPDKKKNRLKRQKKKPSAGFSHLDGLMLEAFAAQIAPVIARRSTDVAMANAMSKESVKSSATGSLLAAFASDHEQAYHNERSSAHNRLKGKANMVKMMVRHGVENIIEGGEVAEMLNQPLMNLPTLAALRVWGHGCLDYTLEQLVGCSMMMMLEVGCASVGVDHMKATAYFAEVYSRYNRVPYHNMYHAFNVLQGCFSIVSTSEMAQQFTAKEKVAMLIAAAGHDAGHDGVNSAFHVAVDSELTSHYNDRSPLENMHAWHTFDAMRAHDGACDLLNKLASKDRKVFRRQIIDTIIATDMAFHNKKVDEFGQKEKIDMKSQVDRDFLMEVLVHTVDIGHSTFGWAEECRWSRLVATEFQAQVDRERAAGTTPTVFMECTSVAHLGKGQLGFIDYVVKPLYAAMADKIPEMKVPFENAGINRKYWAEVGDGTRPMLGNEQGEDDDLIVWSVNVGGLAVGATHEVMKAAKPVTVLMSEANKSKDWDLRTTGNQRYEKTSNAAPPALSSLQYLPPLPSAMKEEASAPQ